jgi:cytochrome c55X
MSRAAPNVLFSTVLAVIPLLASQGIAAAGRPDAARRVALRNTLEQDCGSCHGLTFKGGLGSPLVPERLRDIPDEALTAIVLNGIPGTPMPPWRVLLSPDDVAWMVEELKRGTPHASP